MQAGLKVFVSGGTGAIGLPAIRALVSAGHDVTAVARSGEKAQRLRDLGAAPVEASIFEREALAKMMVAHDAVVNLATAIPPSGKFMRSSAWAANDRIRREGSSCLVDAALDAGVPRFIQESVCMIYADAGATWIDEQGAVDHFPIAEGNHAAEQSAARFTSAGGCGIVLRFGWFYGPGAAHSEEFFELARRRICASMGAPNGYVSSIHVDDGGSAVAAALAAPAGRYNVVDDEPVTWRDYTRALANAAGVRRYLTIPGRLAFLLGDKTTSLTRSIRVSNQRFRETTGWRPRYPSVREGWRATAAVLAKR